MHGQSVVRVRVNAMKFFPCLRHRIDVNNNIREVASFFLNFGVSVTVAGLFAYSY